MNNQHRPEMAALMNAYREGIPAALMATSGQPAIEQLKLQLQTNQSMQPDAAGWSVDSWHAALSATSAKPQPPKEETVWDLIRILASFAVVAIVCVFIAVNLTAPVLGFFLGLMVGAAADFSSGNYAALFGKAVITVVAGGLFFLLLKMAVKLGGIVKRAILK